MEYPRQHCFKSSAGLIFCFMVLAVTCVAQTDKVTGRTWAVRMAESIMNRHRDRYDDWNYVTGTVLRGFEEVWRLTGDAKYYNYIKDTIDPLVHEDGSIDGYRIEDYNLDEVQSGRMILFLFKETDDEKYRKAADLIRSQFKGHPRIKAGGLWHKKIYPWQMWLDGLYMGQPFYAEYAMMFNEPAIFDDVVKQFQLIHDNLRDKKTGLYYHAWDESRQMFWANKKTGLSQCIWGRGVGWFCMAIVDVLDFLPETHQGREQMVTMLQELAESLTRYQDPETGLWWQVMDQGGRKGNYLEGSGSAMFVYSLAKAIRKNYIDEKYMDTVLKGFKGLTTDLMYLDSRGDYNLLRICQGAGLGGNYKNKIRDGSYGYYVYIEPIVPNDGKATGPFLAACVELDRMGY